MSVSAEKCYRLIIFDWDGTLMDSERRIVDAIQHAAREAGLPVLDEKTSASIIGLSLTRAIEQLYPRATPEQVEAMAAAYSRHFLQESDIPMRPFDGAEALLRDLKAAGAMLAIATGKSRRGLDQILPESGLAHYFDVTRTPVEAASKPDPLMLEQILQETGVPVEQALMVGDTTFDMEMARNAGMDRVAVSFGVHDHAELDAFGPLAHFHHLDELRQWLLPRVCQGKG
ncbi:HAD-IA family hydrolase [Sulfurivirga sp.]|uniref:HAD family hydrolase n=1 Tax=Sulfurivirga sp. TaxID=2614236 RepID=UPI0025F9C6F4|nr:HAD-IA family hydrolase [Sulfurivirga sp.]